MTSKDFFFCYDFKMKKHLSDNGHRFIVHARSIKNDMEFWLFPKSPGLQGSIDEFIARKKHVKSNIVFDILEKSC